MSAIDDIPSPSRSPSPSPEDDSSAPEADAIPANGFAPHDHLPPAEARSPLPLTALSLRVLEEETPKILDVMGAVLGGAIGDAMGKPTEFIASLEKIQEKFPGGVTSFEDFQDKWRKDKTGRAYAPYTDDTQMAKVVLETMILSRDNDWTLGKTMSQLAHGFVRWVNDPTTILRAPGGSCTGGARALEKKVREGKHRRKNWWKVGNLQGGGSGSVMRAYPVGLIFAGDLDKAKRWAVAQSRLTHQHPMALAACAAMAVGTGLAMQTKDPHVVVDRMIAAARKYDRRTADLMRLSVERVARGEEPREVLGEQDLKGRKLFGWRADQAIAAAVYIFLRHPEDPRAAIIEGVNTPGDSDTIATLAGALTGVFAGIGHLPLDWVGRVEDSDDLLRLAQQAAIQP